MLIGWKFKNDCSSFRHDADVSSSSTLVLELHKTVYHRKQRVVFTQSNVKTRLQDCSSLPNDNRSASDILPAEPLDTKPLGVAVPSVPGTSTCFFMSHIENSR